MNYKSLTSTFPSFLSSILNSYTQIFFSNSRIFFAKRNNPEDSAWFNPASCN